MRAAINPKTVIIKTLITFSLLSWTILLASNADQPNTTDLGILIAQSHIITTGTLKVPVDQIQSHIKTNHHDYIDLVLNNAVMLKGAASSTLTVRWHTKTKDYAPSPEQIIALNGKNALLFLVIVEEDSVKGFYFAGYTPKAAANPDNALIEKVNTEISEQKQMLRTFAETLPPASEPLFLKIKKLIDATTRKNAQKKAFTQLEELGEKAVPAIIMLMDDRRDLAIPAISLRNKSPEAWEASRHYGPTKIVDAMEAILNQITGYSFGNICNGGTERERQATVDGWRIFLHYLKNGSLKVAKNNSNATP